MDEAGVSQRLHQAAVQDRGHDSGGYDIYSPDPQQPHHVGVGITEKGSWGIAVPKILELARETSPAGRCHHGVAACSDLGPSGVVWHFCVYPLSATFCTLLLSVPDLVNK